MLNKLCAFFSVCLCNISVPRKVLIDRYESTPEADEPLQTDIEQDQDDLYDDDQFYKESEAIPPAPKLQGDLASKDRPSDIIPSIITVQSSSVRPPLRNRDDSSLDGKLNIKIKH